MIDLKFIDDELFYFVYTNKGHNLILFTRDGKLATQVDAALKNVKNDSHIRIKAVRDKKAAW